MTHLLEISEPIYRACSNFEFYNISEPDYASSTNAASSSVRDNETPGRSSLNTNFLKLKLAEQDIISFVKGIVNNGQDDAKKRQTTSLLSNTKAYTYVLSIPLSSFENNIDIDALAVGADALELRVDSLRGIGNHSSHGGLLSYISCQFAHLRRQTTAPLVYPVPLSYQASTLTC